MLRITRLDELGKDTVEADDVNIDYSDKLDIYLICTSIGAREPRNPEISGWLKNGESGR